MKRVLLYLVMLTAPGSAWATEEAPYYGPSKHWRGIGYKIGYDDHDERDGSWRIEAGVRGHGEAIDMAMYRAAERARDEGYRYIFFLGGQAWTAPGSKSATVYARPSHEAVAPTDCRSKRAGTCYTADVAEVLRVLGGPNGVEPGVAIADHQDQFGRNVYLSGFGIGAVATSPASGGQMRQTTIVRDGGVQIRSSGPSVSARPSMSFVPAPKPPLPATAMQATVAGWTSAHERSIAEDELRDKALKDAQPVRGGNRKQGWTISD